NDERVIFFTKGVIETVKKLNWAPDIIHVHGWMASLLPLYMRNYYGNEPLFVNSKIVTSVFNNGFEGSLDEDMEEKVLFDGLDEERVAHLKNPTFEALMKTAIDNSDAVIRGSEELSESLEEYLAEKDLPILDYKTKIDFAQAYRDFYINEVLNEEKED